MVILKKGARRGCISPQAALALGPLSPPGLGYWRKCHSSVHHHLWTEELPSLYRDNKYEKTKLRMWLLRPIHVHFFTVTYSPPQKSHKCT